MADKTQDLLIVEDVRTLAETYAAYLADENHRIPCLNAYEIRFAATLREVIAPGWLY